MPLTPPDYTNWPTVAAVTDRLTVAGITLRASQVTDRMQAAMNAVIAEVGQETRRQFVPGQVGETRLYNGSGTSEQEVDEMVSFTQADVFGLTAQPGYTLANVLLVFEQGLPQTRLVVGQGSLPAYSTYGVMAPVSYLFPAGRQNIRVTGQFGYAATIPADLWEAVCGEMAMRLAREALFSPAGRVNFDKAGDEEKRYKLDDATATGWHDDFLGKLNLYKRPSGRRLRNLHNRMI